jgi:hypothetical protein
LTDNPAARLWELIKDQFVKEADHLVGRFLPEAGARPLVPNDSYLRVSLSELFLANEREWGADRIPAVQASVKLLFCGPRPQAFATLIQPSVTTRHGAFEDYLLTEWLPYRGQPVELEAALYEVLGKNNLRTAISIVSDFASLVTPPVSAALAVVDKVSAGIEKVIVANAKDPTLVLHGTLSGASLRPGWLPVVRASERELPADSLTVNAEGRLSRDGARLTGYDYIVLRIEGTDARADWRTPDLDEAISAALYARDLGRHEDYDQRRAHALGKIYFSPDFTPRQRRQLALAVRQELDQAVPGAAAEGGMTIGEIVARRGLPSRAEAQHLTIEELLAPLAGWRRVEAEGPVGAGRERQRLGHGTGVERPVDVRERLARSRDLVIAQRRGQPLRVDHQQHQVRRAPVERVRHAGHLPRGRRVDEALLGQGHAPGGGGVAALGQRALPVGGQRDVIDDGHGSNDGATARGRRGGPPR